MEDMMDSVVGPHFSVFRLDSRRLFSSSSPSRSANGNAASGFASPKADAGTRKPFVIGVCGGTALGKTMVCDMIIQQLHDHRVVLVNQVQPWCTQEYLRMQPATSVGMHEKTLTM